MKINNIEMPADIKADDLKYPSYKSKVKRVYEKDFKMMFTERFGWCIPTLQIARGRRGFADRTYAISIKGENVRIGQGPHVLATVQIYVTAKNETRLQKYFDIQHKGAVDANECRDRRSTLMMRRTSANVFGGWR